MCPRARPPLVSLPQSPNIETAAVKSTQINLGDRNVILVDDVDNAKGPQIVGAALNRISEDPEIEAALFEVLENQKLLEGKARITLVPRGGELLPQLLAASTRRQDPAVP